MKRRIAPLVVTAFLIASTPTAWAVNGSRTTAAGGVVVRGSIPTGAVANTGDRVAFEVQTLADAAVVVFSIDAAGYVHLLYPSGMPEVRRAHESIDVPESDFGTELVVDTGTGMEFVFALAVADPASFDRESLDALRAADLPGGDPYRIDGDPFIAANMIAAELVRGISRRGASFGYTYFHVNQRVSAPCYLCGACDDPAAATCDESSVVQDFDRRDVLSYPLRRGFSFGEQLALEDDASLSVPEGSDVNVNFYPYGSEVRYTDPYYSAYPSSWWWWDPYYWYPSWYYPYCGPDWYVSIGWGFGWGYWGGYYCSGWYDPYYCYPYSSGGGGYVGSAPGKFKSGYAAADGGSPALAKNRSYATQRDGSLRIAQKDIRSSLAKPASASGTTRVSKSTASRSRYSGDSVTRLTQRGKDGALRQSTRGSAGAQRLKGTTRSATRETYRSGQSRSTTRGKSTGPGLQRGGTTSRSKSSGVAPSRTGFTGSKGTQRGSSSSTRMKSGGTSGSRSSAPRSSGSTRSAPRSSGGRSGGKTRG